MSKHSDETVGPRARSHHEAGFPSWRDRDAPQDGSRRRFLKQLAAGTGALVAGLPRLSHGQSLPIDFAKLDRHPTAEVLALETTQSDDADNETIRTLANSQALAEAADPVDLEQARADTLAASADEMARPADEAADVLADAPATWVEENRALWVEPGYLVLLKWERPEDDIAVVAALEGSADQVASYLTSRVTSVDQLHNIDQLHPLEHDLVVMLAPLVAPARIGVLHLDHDCTTVCAALDPSTAYPERFEIMGDIAAPGWE